MNTRPLLLLVALALLGPLATASAQAPLKRPLLNACAGDRSNVPYWTNALKAQDPQLRVRAAQNLGEARSAAAVPALMDALKDENPDVRLEAERALRKINRR
ncbi:MAG: HEAT domain-containing protein [Candidatus Rokubacteria bacterium CSP1-6]|nr:MAG: HEAT domain-containing protein [Candidatus Rokubacteria bacterium CSP1-6]